MTSSEAWEAIVANAPEHADASETRTFSSPDGTSYDQVVHTHGLAAWSETDHVTLRCYCSQTFDIVID